MSEEKKFMRGFATRAIHGSDIAKGPHAPVSTPIFQTSTFDVKQVLKGGAARPEFIYTRGGNPTTREFEQKMPDFEKVVRAEVKKGRVKVTDTWDEMAGWIGAAPDTLKATLTRYNSFCEHGYDEDYAKERRYLKPLLGPPFYAIKGVTAVLDTIGGIRINEHMEVLNSENEVIPGLFASIKNRVRPADEPARESVRAAQMK